MNKIIYWSFFLVCAITWFILAITAKDKEEYEHCLTRSQIFTAGFMFFLLID